LACINARCPPEPLYHPRLLSWTGDRKYDERLEARHKDRERSLTSYHCGQTRLNLGRKGNLSPIKSEKDNEK